MGGGQSQESSTATATRNSVDQRISGRDVSSRKSAGVPPSSSSQIDSSRRRYLVVDDGLRGDRGGRGGGESDDSPSARHHSLSQPSPHHPPHSHLHVHSHHGNSSHNQRPHPHRQQHRHHNHRPPPPPLPDSFPPVNMELSVPILTSSRTQPMANEPTTESLHPELGLVLPSRHRRYYEARNPEDMELDLSMASLSRRLRAVGLIAEDSGNGGSANGGSGSSSSSRRHHRPRRHHSHNSHSGRSRHHLSTPSSVVLVRGLSASKFMHDSCPSLPISYPSFLFPSVCLSPFTYYSAA